jgi:nicotinamide phosphoribosyltransferase
MGSGGGLLQKLNRDTQDFAFKCSAAKIDNEWVDVYKDPVGDSGKKSKRGRLMLCKDGGKFRTQRESIDRTPNELRVVYRNGEMVLDVFEKIRNRCRHT